MYKFIAGQRKTLIAAQLKVGTFINSYKYFEKDPNPNFINLRNKLDAEYWIEEKDIEPINEFGKKYLDKEFTKNIKKSIKKHNKKAAGLISLLNTTDFNDLSKTEIVNILNLVYKNLFELMGTLFLSQDIFTLCVENNLKETLKKEFKNNKERNELFNVLITPFKLNAVNKELLYWYKFVLRNQNPTNTELKDYILRNGWLVYNEFNCKNIDNFIQKRYQKDSKNRSKLQKEIENLSKEQQEKKLIFNKKTRGISLDTKHLAEVLRDLADLRLEIKLINNSLETSLNLTLLRHIAKQNNIDFVDLLDGYFREDVENLILNKIKISSKEIQNRKNFVGFVGKDNETEILTGEKARKQITSLLNNQKLKSDKTTLKGQMAYSGNAKGNAKIIRLGDNSQLIADLKKFKKGDIIVTIMTQPNIMPIIKKAGGIITDEGGICSHAAIISRELQIPCIVGTGTATKMIRDGDLVEIDSKNSTVNVLNK